jgi:IrrE N-terminal-like domain
MPLPSFKYRHDSLSLEPSHLTTREVWRLGSQAREHLCRYPDHPRVDIADLAGRARRLVVNGLHFETHWEFDGVVHDEGGDAAFGSVSHQPGGDVAIIALNSELIGDRDELWRSTAAHELGHAILDVPGWIKASLDELPAKALKRHLLRTKERSRLPKPVMDWPEWRATEFMGALLAPRRLLATHLQRKAVELGLPLTLRHSMETPLLNADACGHDGVEAIVLELAELFGLSPSFVQVRLNKYQLLYSF